MPAAVQGLDVTVGNAQIARPRVLGAPPTEPMAELVAVGPQVDPMTARVRTVRPTVTIPVRIGRRSSVMTVPVVGTVRRTVTARVRTARPGSVTTVQARVVPPSVG